MVIAYFILINWRAVASGEEAVGNDPFRNVLLPVTPAIILSHEYNVWWPTHRTYGATDEILAAWCRVVNNNFYRLYCSTSHELGIRLLYWIIELFKTPEIKMDLQVVWQRCWGNRRLRFSFDYIILVLFLIDISAQFMASQFLSACGQRSNQREKVTIWILFD